MAQYKIKISNTDTGEIVRAGSELEAKVKYCQDKGLLYRLYSGLIEAEKIKRGKIKK